MTAGSESDRTSAADKIRNNPDHYKVCEGCGSIVVSKAGVCPNCNAYRFDSSAEAVLKQVDILVARQPLSIDKRDYL